MKSFLLQQLARLILPLAILLGTVPGCGAPSTPTSPGVMSRPAVALDPRLASLPYEARITAIAEALGRLGAQPVAPSRGPSHKSGPSTSASRARSESGRPQRIIPPPLFWRPARLMTLVI